MTGESGDPHHVFIEVDEDDPIAGLQLRAIGNGGDSFVAGGIVPEPGRYELRRVEDAE